MRDRIEERTARSWRPLGIRLAASEVTVLVLLVLLVPARGWAAAYGSVTGVVRNDSDQPVAGAKVVLESASHSTLERRTDSAGR